MEHKGLYYREYEIYPGDLTYITGEKECPFNNLATRHEGWFSLYTRESGVDSSEFTLVIPIDLMRYSDDT